jgi:hypothetical protein
MVEDAGSIQAEIKLNIDDLKKGAMAAQKAIKDMETKIKKSKAEINNAFRNGTRAVFEYGVEIKNIELAEKTGSISAQEASKAKVVAAQKYLDVLIDTRNRIAEVDGETSKQVVLYDNLIKKQVEIRDSAEEIEKSTRKAAAAGTLFVSGFGKGQVELNNKLNEFVSTMQGISPRMGSLGVKIASAFSKPIFSMIPILSAAFQAMLPVIGTIIAAVAAIAAAVKKGVSAYKEQTKEINASNEASTRLKGTYVETTKTLEEQVKIWDRIRGIIGTLGVVLGDVGAFFKGELGTLKEIYDAQVAVVAEARLLKDVNTEVNEAEARYKQTLEEIQTAQDTYHKDEKEANLARLSALDSITDELIKQMEIARDKAGNAQLVENIKERLRLLKLERDRLKEITKEEPEKTKKPEKAEEQVKEINLLTQAQEAYRATLAQIKNQEDAYFIDTSEAMSQRLAAEQQYVKTLSGLRTEYKQLGNVTEEQLAHISAEEAAHIANAKALQTVIDYQKQYTDETARLKAGYEQISAEMGNETTLASLMATEAEKRAAALEKQRDAELAALKTRYDAIAASRESGELTAEEINHRDMLTDAINKNYNALRQLSDTEAVTAAQQDILEYGKEIRNQYQGILKDITGEETIQNRLVALALEQTNQRKAQKTLNDLNREAALEEVEKYFDKIAAQRESGELTAEETAERERLTAAIDQNYEAVKRLENQQAVTATLEEISASGKKIDEQYKDITRQLAEQEILRNETLTDKEKEVALNDLSRQAALDELEAQFDKLKAQRESGELTEEEIALYDQLKGKINLTYDAAKSGIKEAKKEAIDYKAVTLQIAEASVKAFTDITSAISTIAQQQAQAAMEEIDKALEQSKKSIEEAREAQLVEEGFMEAQRSEDMQAQIDAAREANDQVLEYQLRRRQREMEINEQYDAEVKAAEKKANKEKAEQEYKAAQTKYELDLTSAIVSGALAVAQAAVNTWPIPAIPMMAAAGASTGAQIAVIAANPPKLKFATGGIVPGQPHSNTDTVPGWLTPGEVILNRAQQETLVPQLAQRPLIIQNNMDGRLVAEVVINDYVNKSIVIIDGSRGVR